MDKTMRVEYKTSGAISTAPALLWLLLVLPGKILCVSEFLANYFQRLLVTRVVLATVFAVSQGFSALFRFFVVSSRFRIMTVSIRPVRIRISGVTIGCFLMCLPFVTGFGITGSTLCRPRQAERVIFLSYCISPSSHLFIPIALISVIVGHGRNDADDEQEEDCPETKAELHDERTKM